MTENQTFENMYLWSTSHRAYQKMYEKAPVRLTVRISPDKTELEDENGNVIPLYYLNFINIEGGLQCKHCGRKIVELHEGDGTEWVFYERKETDS